MRAESLTWQRTPTPEQEASYDEVEPWVTSVPETPVEKAVKYTLMHIFDDPEDVGVWPTQMLPRIQTSLQFKRTVTTGEVTRQITGTLRPVTLRRVTTTDPYLPSVRITSNDLAIVPQRASVDNEVAHVTPVQRLIEQKIAALYAEKQRLPLHITVSFIRYEQHRRNTSDSHHFTYKGEMIPISGAAIGAFLIDEVRLD